MVMLVTKCTMAAGSSNSVAGVLIQLSEASNSSSDEQDNEVDDTIEIAAAPQLYIPPQGKLRLLYFQYFSDNHIHVHLATCVT